MNFLGVVPFAASFVGGTVLLVACAGAAREGAVEATPPPAAPAVTASSAAEVPPPALDATTAPTATQPIVPEPTTPFPPHAITVPSTKSASAGDGIWTAFGNAALGEHAATGPFIVRTVLHPHPDSRFLTVTIAAVDLQRVQVRLVAGTEDLLWAQRPVGPAAGLVPPDDRARLLAVMNGGFQPKHGHWGMMPGGTTIASPKDDGCTLAIYHDESVRLATWSKIAHTLPAMASFRQTPPCLLEDGVLHPALLRGDDKRWAGHAADLETRRRSAAGLDATGHILFYAIGEEASPRWLAEALYRAGAASALELDINWYWTRFLLFGAPPGEPLQITSTLIPKMEHLKKGYVERPSTRDFFYLMSR